MEEAGQVGVLPVPVSGIDCDRVFVLQHTCIDIISHASSGTLRHCLRGLCVTCASVRVPVQLLRLRGARVSLAAPAIIRLSCAYFVTIRCEFLFEVSC